MREKSHGRWVFLLSGCTYQSWIQIGKKHKRVSDNLCQRIAPHQMVEALIHRITAVKTSRGGDCLVLGVQVRDGLQCFPVEELKSRAIIGLEAIKICCFCLQLYSLNSFEPLFERRKG